MNIRQIDFARLFSEGVEEDDRSKRRSWSAVATLAGKAGRCAAHLRGWRPPAASERQRVVAHAGPHLQPWN